MKWFLLLLLAGCASMNSEGVRLANQGKNQEALNTFLTCARQGEPECMYNVGWMWQAGRINGPNRQKNAVGWYTLAARHGFAPARVTLAQLGAPVPPPDMVREMSPEEYAAMNQLAGQLGQALGGYIGSRR